MSEKRICDKCGKLVERDYRYWHLTYGECCNGVMSRGGMCAVGLCFNCQREFLKFLGATDKERQR